MAKNWSSFGRIGAALQEFLVLVRDTMTRLNVDPAIIDWANTENGRVAFTRALELFVRCYQGSVVEANKILEFISTVTTLATTTKFVAKDKFVININPNTLVKISYLGDNFTNWFLSGDGKTEDPISEQTLRYHKLRKSSVDGPIITELGGEEKSETTLTEMFSLMEKQKNVEDDVLLNNGYANIFYIRDQNGVLRTVDVRWYDDGWYVSTHSVEDQNRWDSGYHVFG